VIRLMSMSMLMLAACQVGPSATMPDVTPTGDWLHFEPAAPTGYDLRFRGQAVRTLLPDEISELNGRCPRLRRVTMVKDSETFWIMSAEGDGFDNIDKVGAVFEGHKRADALHKIEDGRLIVPVGCSGCSVFFGVKLSTGAWASCSGPGFSLWVEDGVPSVPVPSQ
jgi:hypothetical protein